MFIFTGTTTQKGRILKAEGGKMFAQLLCDADDPDVIKGVILMVREELSEEETQVFWQEMATKQIKVKERYYLEVLGDNDLLRRENDHLKEMYQELTERSNMPEPLIDNMKRRWAEFVG